MKKPCYHRYDFDDGVPFKVSRNACDCNSSMAEVKEMIEEAINRNNQVSCQLNCATNHIIDEIHAHALKPCFVQQIATKDDVAQAVQDVNKFTNNKFEEVDFEGQFSDLNEQVRQLIGKF